MKKANLLLLFIFCLAKINAQTTKVAPPIDGYKYIQISEPIHDFGQFVYGKAISYDVNLKNISKDTLYLSNVVVSCGCTTPHYNKKIVAPDSSINMTIGFNGYVKGKLNKTISLIFQFKDKQFVNILRYKGVGYMDNKSQK